MLDENKNKRCDSLKVGDKHQEATDIDIMIWEYYKAVNRYLVGKKTGYDEYIKYTTHHFSEKEKEKMIEKFNE